MAIKYKFFTIDEVFITESSIPPKHDFTGILVKPDFWKAWYKNDLLHREDGPVAEFIGCGRQYYLNGKNLKINTVEELKLLVDLMKLKKLMT